MIKKLLMEKSKEPILKNERTLVWILFDGDDSEAVYDVKASLLETE